LSTSRTSATKRLSFSPRFSAERWRADPLFVTLNPIDPVREDLIYDEHVFRHPVFDRAALGAQREIADIQGRNRTWFAGAWLGHGFHEDGWASGAAVASTLNRIPA
jgi:predicted NAD/FAD-binding protein